MIPIAYAPPASPASQKSASLVSRILVPVTCLCVIAFTGLWFIDREAGRKADRAAVVTAAKAASALPIVDQADLEANWLAAAVRDHRAILGMTRQEVLMAKGEPRTVLKGDALPTVAFKYGGVEGWIYPGVDGEPAVIMYGASGLVVWSRDTAQEPNRESNQIRAGR